MIIAIILFAIAVLCLAGCKKPTPSPNPNPDPEPEPQPDEPKWEDFFPDKWYLPTIDWNKGKWINSNYNSELWQRYTSKIVNWNNELSKLPIEAGEVSDRKLYLILNQKKPDGKYLFEWTSDLEVWGKEDYWAAPEEFLEYPKNQDGEMDLVNGCYRDDCDGFARFHCQYLTEWANYWCVLFLEVYWRRKSNDVWKSLGHAITVYKQTSDTDWKCFSNQTWLSSVTSKDSLLGWVYTFVPIDNPIYKENYQLIKVVAREPITGNLLFEVKEF